MKNKNVDVRFAQPSQISQQLLCPICTVVLFKPFRLLCGHVFCSECFEEYVAAPGVCPLDRSKVDFDTVHIDPVGKAAVDRLPCFCRRRPAGCAWIGPRRDLQRHERGCDFAHVLQTPTPPDRGASQATFCGDAEQLEERLELCVQPVDLRLRAYRKAGRLPSDASQSQSLASCPNEQQQHPKLQEILAAMDRDGDVIYELFDLL